jgi:molecular chaperone DnaK
MDDIDILGIDLGTTNSAIAIWRPRDDRAEVLRNPEGSALTPSAVFYSAPTDTPLVGREALGHLLDQPDAVVRSVKRFMGRTADDSGVDLDRRQVSFDVQEEPGSGLVLRAGGHRLTPTMVSAAVLTKLKNDASASLGRAVERAVITVPAYFEEPQRQATKEAGQLAGLEVPRIISEPTAAALAFGLGADSQTVAVYDLGGGTFDVSVVTVDDGLFRVKGTSGDTHLGGDDFDRVIARWLAQEFEREQSVSLPPDDKRVRALLHVAAERAKVALTTENEHVVRIPGVLGSRDLEITLSRTKFEELVWPSVERTLRICDDLLNSIEREKGFSRAEISQVLLVGGQTRAHVVRKAIHERFGWSLNFQINPDEAVAEGAAALGARLCGHLADRIRLWDVTPLTLGIQLASGRLEPIIKANSQIPVRVWRRGGNGFTTNRDGQEQIRFRVFQGERPLAQDNTAVGEVVLELGSPRDARAAHIACLFRIDQDGILHIRAEDEDADGNAVEANFDRTYQLTRTEIETRKREAETKAAEDHITHRLLALTEHLERASNAPGANQAFLDSIKAAIEARDPDRAEELLTSAQAGQ